VDATVGANSAEMTAEVAMAAVEKAAAALAAEEMVAVEMEEAELEEDEMEVEVKAEAGWVVVDEVEDSGARMEGNAR